LASDAFSACAQYEAAIAAYFNAVAPAEGEVEATSLEIPAELLPKKITLQLKQINQLRYGENPHQQAARYVVDGMPSVPFQVLQGKEMSYNNFVDAAAVMNVVSAEYPHTYVACVVKHLNPCGIAVGDDPVKTYINAREADAKSAFGGIVGLNYNVDLEMAKELRRTFLEIIVAPSFDSDALQHLSSKKNLRLIQADPTDYHKALLHGPKMVTTFFGALLQSQDTVQETWDQLEFVTEAQPPEEKKEDILLGLTFIRFLKSNSLCVVKDAVMIGRGVGQMSRVDAAELAIQSAGRRIKGSVLVSDGYFPFTDGIELAAKADVACVVAPAGSKRDMEVVAAANKLKLPLVFAPYRHFQH
jgi:phosphoribosylaminoimidazolecarboxamide formyltransferase/IMP cyclohydrolase